MSPAPAEPSRTRACRRDMPPCSSIRLIGPPGSRASGRSPTPSAAAADRDVVRPVVYCMMPAASLHHHPDPQPGARSRTPDAPRQSDQPLLMILALALLAVCGSLEDNAPRQDPFVRTHGLALGAAEWSRVRRPGACCGSVPYRDGASRLQTFPGGAAEASFWSGWRDGHRHRPIDCMVRLDGETNRARGGSPGLPRRA